MVKGGGGWMIPIGAGTINRDRSIGLELLTCRLVGCGKRSKSYTIDIDKICLEAHRQS